MRRWAYVLALALALPLAYDLARIPVQVSDSLGFILDAQSIPSTADAFVRAFALDSGYLRPLRFAQIKAVFDASQGHYTLAFRGVHLLLLLTAVILFVRALRVTTGADLAAAAFALAVFTGLHTFAGTLREAYPINHFLETIVMTLAALNIAQARPGWTRDAAAAALFVVAALVLESGLLVWVVVVAAWVSGMRGVSSRGVLVMSSLLVGYLAIRFLLLAKGVPALDARPSGFLLERLEPADLEARFGSHPAMFYAYNVASSISSVLFAEPRAGVWVAVRDYLRGDIPPRTIVSILSSLLTTILIAVAAARGWRHGRLRDGADRLFVVFAAVLVANAALSYAYTKDEIVSVAGTFYALAAYAAVRGLILWSYQGPAEAGRYGGTGMPRNPVLVSLLTTALFIASTGWALRVAGQHYALRATAFVTRNDWASLPSNLSDTEPDKRAIVERLRRDALNRRVVAPYFVPRWQQRWFDE